MGGGSYSLSVKAFSYYIAIGIDLSTQNQTDDSAHIRMLPSETRLFFDFFIGPGPSSLSLASVSRSLLLVCAS